MAEIQDILNTQADAELKEAIKTALEPLKDFIKSDDGSEMVFKFEGFTAGLKDLIENLQGQLFEFHFMGNRREMSAEFAQSFLGKRVKSGDPSVKRKRS